MGFFGDFLGSVVGPGATALGTLLGGPAGAVVGGGLGSALSNPLRSLPFKKGGMVPPAPYKAGGRVRRKYQKKK